MAGSESSPEISFSKTVGFRCWIKNCRHSMETQEATAHPGLPELTVPSLDSLIASTHHVAGFPSFEALSPINRLATSPLTSSNLEAPSSLLFDQLLMAEPQFPDLRRSRRVAARAARVAEADPAPVTQNVTWAASGASGSTRKRTCSRDEEENSPGAKKSCTKPPPKSTFLPNPKDDSLYMNEEVPVKKEEEDVEETDQVPCCICMCEPEGKDLSAVNGCDHKFCWDCIGTWANRENTCPLCKARFSKISRVHKCKRRKGEKSSPQTKSVRERNQRADLVSGAVLESMLNSITASSNRSSVPSRLNQFLVAQLHGQRVRMRPVSTRRTTLLVEETLLDSDEESNDSLPGLDFNELMRQTMAASRHSGRRINFGTTVGASAPTVFNQAAAGATSSASPYQHVSGHRTVVGHSVPAGGINPYRRTGGNSVPAGGFNHYRDVLLSSELFRVFLQMETSQPQARSHAVNASDSNAGRAAENPLEINDSDEDDAVEIIDHPTAFGRR